MTLRYDTLQSIGAVLAASGKWPHLLAAVDNELAHCAPRTDTSGVQSDTIGEDEETAPAVNEGRTPTSQESKL